MRFPARVLVGAFAFYAAIVAWLTWPLVSEMSTHLPDTVARCRYDAVQMAWVLSHESRTLVTDPGRLGEGNIYFPARHSLFYGQAGYGALPYFAPTFLATGNPALALNLMFLGCVVLAACVIHLVVFTWTGSHVGSFIAAWTFLMSRWVLWEFLPAAPSYSALHYLPLIIFLAAIPTLDWKGMVWWVPLLVLQCLTDLVYITTAVVACVGTIALVRSLRRDTRMSGLRLLVSMAIALLLVSPLYVEHLRIRAENPLLSRQTYWKHVLGHTHLPWGPFTFSGSPVGVPVVVFVLVLAGALSFALTREPSRTGRNTSAWAHAAFWFVFGLLISLTPTVFWYEKPVRLPQALIADRVPIYDFLRAPDRLSVVSLIGLSLLSGLAFCECVRRVPRRIPEPIAKLALGALITAVMYAQYSRGTFAMGGDSLPRSYPLRKAITGDSPLVQVLQQRGGPLLEVPVKSDYRRHVLAATFQARAMYRSIFHQRELLNGYHSYWPAGFQERMSLASELPARQPLQALRQSTGLAMVLVHASDLDEPKRAEWMSLVASGGRDGLRFVARDGDDLLFSVDDSPAEQLR